MREKCQDENQSDLLRKLPVFDQDSLVTYKNIFCARSNGATNTTYWNLQFDCGTWLNVRDVNLGDSMVLLHQNCSVDKRPKQHHLNFLKRCIPQFQDCHNISQEKNESYCQTDCLGYAFPVCSCSKKIRFRNPQCALCNGFTPNDLHTECKFRGVFISPPLTILFDFISTSKYSVTVNDRKEKMVKKVEKVCSCCLDEVYDPFVGNCKRVVEDNRANTTRLHANCTFIAFNRTDFVWLSNDSVFLKLHNKVYRNNTCRILDDKLLVHVCVNFSRNSTRSVNENGKHKITEAPAILRIFTSMGCIVSMVSSSSAHYVHLVY